MPLLLGLQREQPLVYILPEMQDFHKSKAIKMTYIQPFYSKVNGTMKTHSFHAQDISMSCEALAEKVRA